MKELPWSALAMCIDCEGCISIGYNSYKATPKSNGIYNMEISVRNTDVRLMKWLVSNFGGRYGSTDQKESWKISYLWRVTGRANRERILLGILPYLILKREQALIAIEFVRIKKWERAVERRHELMLACKKLNARGRPAPTTNTQDDLPNCDVIACGPSFKPNLKESKIESELHGDMQSAPVVIQGGNEIPDSERYMPGTDSFPLSLPLGGCFT